MEPEPLIGGGDAFDNHRDPARDGVPLRAHVAVEVPALIATGSPGKQRLQHLPDEPLSLPALDIGPCEVVDVHDHRHRCCDPVREPGLAGRAFAVDPNPAGAAFPVERSDDGRNGINHRFGIHPRPHRAGNARPC